MTGYPLVDAGMRELWRTGWMNNRVRMVAASFLVKHLLIPWQEGAAWFRETLVDADMANNTLGWQWCAGCGADAAPYFRIFNPAVQAAKFDPDGALRAPLGSGTGGDRDVSAADRGPCCGAAAGARRRIAADAREINRLTPFSILPRVK